MRNNLKIVGCWLLLSVFCLAMAGGSALAMDEQEQETFVRTLTLSHALGQRFGNKDYAYQGVTVDFARKIKPSGYLKANKAEFIGASVLSDDGERMTGTLRYSDPVGRIATYQYTIDYTVKAQNHFRIDKVGIKTYEPVKPGLEGYFIPKEAISIKQMKKMSSAELLQFARDNEDPLMQGKVGPVKEYHVVVFCMHRLRDDAKWSVLQGERFGTSWRDGEWHITVIDDIVALNGAETKAYRVLYAPGKRSPFHGKIYQVGGVANMFIAPDVGPVKAVEATPETRDLLDRYAAKHMPEIM